MALRVTFDSNTLELACQPERHPRDSRQPLMQRVHEALVTGQIQGYYSVTMLTIEGVMRKDRASVFSGTRIATQPETTKVTANADLPEAVREMVGDADLESIHIEYRAEQPDRKPLHPQTIARMKAANALGLRALRAVPRLGAYQITDPTGEFYLDRGDTEALKVWIDKACEVARAIEDRGVGIAQIKKLGNDLGASCGPSAWFRFLDHAADMHEQRAVERAFSEWADGDSIAAHVAYGLDVFCSDDVGNSNVNNSILDSSNRAWLNRSYGVQFMTFKELESNLT